MVTKYLIEIIKKNIFTIFLISFTSLNVNAINYTLTLNSNQSNVHINVNGTLTLLPTTITYSSGTQVQVSSHTETGLTWDHWVLQGTNYTNDQFSFNMSGNRTLTAYYNVFSCNTPTGLSSTGTTQTSITLTWNSVNGANGYYIYYKRHSISNWEYSFNWTSPSNPPIVLQLTCGTQYDFAIKSDCGSSMSNLSSNVTISTSSCPCITPGTPTTNSPTDISSTGAYFSWSGGSPSGSPTITYYWAVGTSSSVTYESGYFIRGTTTGTSASTNSLNASTPYYFKVKACTNCGSGVCSGYSSYQQFTTNSPPGPSCAANPFPLNDDTDVLNTNLSLSWSNGGGLPTGYKLFFGTNLSNLSYYGTYTTTNCAPPINLSQGITYYWKIIPINNGGDATGCPIWSFTIGTIPNCAINPLPSYGATNVSVNSSITWSSGGGSPNGYGYALCFGTTNPPPFLQDILTNTYTPPSSLLPNQTYYWQIIPYNNWGNAINCPIWEFSTETLPIHITISSTSTTYNIGVPISIIIAIKDNNNNPIQGISLGVDDPISQQCQITSMSDVLGIIQYTTTNTTENGFFTFSFYFLPNNLKVDYSVIVDNGVVPQSQYVTTYNMATQLPPLGQNNYTMNDIQTLFSNVINETVTNLPVVLLGTGCGLAAFGSIVTIGALSPTAILVCGAALELTIETAGISTAKNMLNLIVDRDNSLSSQQRQDYHNFINQGTDLYSAFLTSKGIADLTQIGSFDHLSSNFLSGRKTLDADQARETIITMSEIISKLESNPSNATIVDNLTSTTNRFGLLCKIPDNLGVNNKIRYYATVFYIPDIGLLGHPSSICENDIATIVYNGLPINNVSYNWYWDGGIVLSGSGAGPFQVKWTTPGSKHISFYTIQNSQIGPTTYFDINVNQVLPMYASISAIPNGPICQGTSVCFTANILNGGTNPNYQWQVNGNNVWQNSSTFTSSTLNNNDQVKCIISSNLTCINGNPSTSNTISMAVHPNVIDSVHISAFPSDAICSGSSVNFTAIPFTSGTPSFQWKKNGIDISGATTSSFLTNILVNSDVISCIMTSNATCVAENTVSSNIVIMTIKPYPEAPSGLTTQTFSYAASISNLVANGTDIRWYDAPTGGNLLSTIDALTNGSTYYASQTVGGCESHDRLGVRVNVNLVKTVNLHLYLEGLFDHSTNNSMFEAQDMDWNSGLTFAKYGAGIADKIQVDLFNENSPYNPAGVSISGIDLSTSGIASFQVSPNLTGKYYLRIRSRNHLETWSANAVPFNTTTIDYNFSASAINAYQAAGGNDPQVSVATGIYAFYLGDLDYSMGVDFDDFNLFEPYLNEGTYGFTIADFNGNGLVDFDDFNLFEPRLNQGPFTQYPGMP